MAELPLPGCTPEPLMNYLKALGVFRLIAEQADPDARLSWQGRAACLHTNLDRDQVISFFLEQYKPTPIVGPWGARSGFYSGSSETSARKALEAISSSTVPRLDSFRNVIEAVRKMLDRLGISSKDDLDEREIYLRLLRDLRNELPEDVTMDGVGAWLDAVYTVGDDRKFPPLLGTGGNEGSGSYMSNFCQLVAELIVRRKVDEGVSPALFADPAPVLSDVTVGHFSPNAIGGPNSAVGFGGGGGANPWDFLLALEGTLLFRCAAARRMGTNTEGKAAFPFTVNAIPVGYGSAAGSEDTRAEIWMPEWPNPSTIGEIKQLLGEGRAQLGRAQARNAIEFARAAVSLGTSRGLTGFHRFSLVKRNGLSFFAAYLGRFPVREVPRARLINQLDNWLQSFRQLAGGDKTPARFPPALRRIDAAILDVCRYGDTPEHMQAVLRAVGNAERELAHSVKLRAENSWVRPLSGLSAEWMTACDDGSAEFRLATSIAVMPGSRTGHRPFRMYLEPVVRYGSTGWRFDDAVSGVIWSNNNLASNFANLLTRRLRDGTGSTPAPTKSEPVHSAHPLWVPFRFRPFLSDVMRFLSDDVNDETLTDLLWAIPAIDATSSRFEFHKPKYPAIAAPIDFALLKLVFLTAPVKRPKSPTEISVTNEPRVAALLQAGRLTEAVVLACRRLQSSGLPPYLTAPVAGIAKQVTELPSNAARPRRLLAALLFPLRSNAIEKLVELTIRELKPQTV